MKKLFYILSSSFSDGLLPTKFDFEFRFCFQQDCPNGRLTPAKFVDMYKMFFPSGNAEEFCDHVFRTFDMDKNGYIDFKVSFLNLNINIHSLYVRMRFEQK